MFGENATVKKFMYAKKNLKSSSLLPTSCGAMKLDKPSKITHPKHYKQLLLQTLSQPRPLQFYASSFEFNMTSNFISISTKDYESLENSVVGDDTINYRISIEPIKHNIVKRSAQHYDDGKGRNMCSSSSSNNKWIKITFGQDNNNASLQTKSAITSTKGSTKCVQLLRHSNKKDPPLTWYQANKSCIDLEGKLLKIQSESEQIELEDLILKR